MDASTAGSRISRTGRASSTASAVNSRRPPSRITASGGVSGGSSARRKPGLALSPIYEDLAEGRRSLAKLAALDFDAACFGHGRPIPSGASRRFAEKWAVAAPREPVSKTPA